MEEEFARFGGFFLGSEEWLELLGRLDCDFKTGLLVLKGCFVRVVELLLLLSLEVLLLYHWSGFNFVPAIKRRI